MDWITRPDANGEGGGNWSTSAPFVPGSINEQMDARYKERFDTIHATIDELMFPFLRLAEPSKCDTHIENARTACKSLSCSPSVGEDKTPTGASEITEQLAGIAQALDKMSGETIAAFKQKFLLKLNRTIASLHGASVASSSTLKAEQEIFDKANKAVIEAVTSATAAFIASSDNTAAEIKVTLKILGFAVTAAKAFTGDGVGVGLDLADLGIDIGESAAGGEDFAMDTNGNYESVLSTFQQSLEAIKKDILDSETFIQGYLDKCSTQIDTDHESYDLTVPPRSTARTWTRVAWSSWIRIW
ncbi:hypothetical protein [Schaalia sp. 19OD2882]|uniref:hypothetical protein n=1 Tax=Schaalia sp. 19OD2882 TaxID=2794089 RepID=UPI001C1ECAB3|nr:hypothetical protein [Schaalia sp. 19OD2882]